MTSSASRGPYLVRARRPPSQGWKTFLRSHAAGIAAIDLFVVRTVSLKLLFGLVIFAARWLSKELNPALAANRSGLPIPG